MTNEQVIKAFECCKKIEEGCSHETCFECPMFEEDVDECTASLFRKVLDLIKRQQAEIERLELAYNYSQESLKYWCDECKESVEELATAKSEAYKEFAERLRQVYWSNSPIDVCIREMVDNLVKELTEGSNGK